MSNFNIVQLEKIEEHLLPLSNLLMQIVDGGASVGFLPPMELTEAKEYWQGVISSEVILLVALDADRVVGTVQIHLCNKKNGSHRAEIAKLMTHQDFQRRGIGRILMQQAEARAKELGRSLLVLDTREGDPSNDLYSSIGYIQAGRIPHYTKSATGVTEATIYYYKTI